MFSLYGVYVSAMRFISQYHVAFVISHPLSFPPFC